MASNHPNEDWIPSSQQYQEEPTPPQEEEEPLPNPQPDLPGVKIGYIHGVKNLTESNTPDKRNFFTCMLQTEDSMVRTVCFSPTKRKLFTEVQNSCVPVKISKTTNASGSGDIFFHRDSTVSLMKSVPFPYRGHDVKGEEFVSISDLSQLAPFEFVNVRAQASIVDDPTETIDWNNNEPLAKQEITITDSTGSCTVFLYGDYVGALKCGKSYEIKNLRLRKNANHFYLNSSVKETVTFKEIDNLQDLAAVMKDGDVTLQGIIIGISKVNVQFFCILCNKKATLVNDNTVECVSKLCQSKYGKVNAKSSITLTAPFKSFNATYKLFFNNEMLKKLSEILQFDVDEESIAKTLFSGNLPEILVTFNKFSNTVKNVVMPE
ncbi:uncharacterized protein [Clytia hemisphaerica]|uniref:Uncharacterized protein n=1 Tax=Clytia hemisphaerica TaxID=252671 RepID=A0A7M5XIJ4_9CNID|eukprot:TCONS_00010243-protein